MGNADTKLHFRKAVLQLTTKTQPISSSDEAFWSQFWADHVSSVSDVFVLLPASEVRALRETAPSNLATLCYKAVERLVTAADTGASTHQEQHAVVNCVRILTRVLPYIFEDPDWRSFFWSNLPAGEETAQQEEEESVPLANSLINALCDLLFCPDFTVTPNKKNGPDAHEDVQSLDSCEYIWEAGVGAAHCPPHSPQHDAHRKELLKLLLTCFSQIIYHGEGGEAGSVGSRNPWLCLFTSSSNRHALPLFTSLLNTVCGYDPVGRGLPYNHLLFNDSRESLVEVALQILITALDSQDSSWEEESTSLPDNLFINYLSRIHREEDFAFVLHGFTRLLNNPLLQTYLPHSTKKVNFHQELLVFFWKFCDYNKKFLFYVLKSSEVLEVLVPILFHLNDARADQSRAGLLHIGVFILLLLSGERNFGVRLNKPYTAAVPMDIPVFTGSHADLMIIVFHKIITTGHQRLQPLFDCLLTILVNVSPYIKSLSMVAANKLLHLLEAFCTPWFLFSAQHHHHLVFFLLETFNNIIQYQFDGNSNLVYTLIRKRQVFHSLASLPTDAATINRTVNSRRGGFMAKKWSGAAAPLPSRVQSASSAVKSSSSSSSIKSNGRTSSVEGSCRAEGETSVSEATSDSPADSSAARVVDGDAGTHTASLAALPRLDCMTEQESAHPSSLQLSRLTEPLSADQQDTSNLITALSPGDPATQACDDAVVDVSDASHAADIASSFGACDSQRACTTRVTTATDSTAATDATQQRRIVYPPSPHSSTKVQPAAQPHHSLAFDQLRNQQTGEEAGCSSDALHSSAITRTDSSVSVTALSSGTPHGEWCATAEWVSEWKSKLPLQTIMRLLQVLVPQVEKICIDKGLTDESEILRFLQHGTLVGLLPVPHPILIRKYQANSATATWFRTYMWGIIYLRNVDPPIWYDTDVKLFEIQRV